jgi:hypothetical protein
MQAVRVTCRPMVITETAVITCSSTDSAREEGPDSPAGVVVVQAATMCAYNKPGVVDTDASEQEEDNLSSLLSRRVPHGVPFPWCICRS